MTDTATANTATEPSTGVGNAATKAPGFVDTLASEWRKFWALPASRNVLFVTIAITVGVSALITLFSNGADLAAQQTKGEYNVILFGGLLGVWSYIFLGANFVASEFRTGMLDYTFVATPRRTRVLVSKILIIGVIGLVVGVLISMVNAAMTQSALAISGYPTLNLHDPRLLRAVLLYIAVGMCLDGIVGCLLAVLVRNAVGALVLTILLIILPPMFSQFLGKAYNHTVPRWSLGALQESIAGISKPTTDAYLPTSLALLGAAIWVTVLGIAAIIYLRRADAR
ncbi:MAG: hypothetical protein JO100_15875 [Pseudonocardia sp.]|nr:hypothetical protein [Pseudonocardia sp.]